jgi:hypothetical protein
MEIADRLGHSSPTVTMRTDAHVLPSLEERLRDGLENTFREARTGTYGDQTGTRTTPMSLQGGASGL